MPRKQRFMASSWSQDEQMVDVHFLTGTETTGFNLHINGEGAGVAKQGRLVRALGKSWKHQVLGLANFCSIIGFLSILCGGSRDAKFLVHLNEKALHCPILSTYINQIFELIQAIFAALTLLSCVRRRHRGWTICLSGATKSKDGSSCLWEKQLQHNTLAHHIFHISLISQNRSLWCDVESFVKETDWCNLDQVESLGKQAAKYWGRIPRTFRMFRPWRRCHIDTEASILTKFFFGWRWPYCVTAWVQNPNCWTARILPMICQCCNTFGCIGYIFVYFCYMLLLLPTDINRLQAVATRRSRLDNMTLVGHYSSSSATPGWIWTAKRTQLL